MARTGLDELTRAAIRSGSDKYGGHLYTPVYHTLFSARREQQLRVLEIGVGGYDVERAGGLSLAMWASYFPYATIVGLDIHRKVLDLPARVHLVQGSQADGGTLAHVTEKYGPFDIIIDDGSHVVEHQLASFRHLYTAMQADGIYAIEDTQTSFMPSQGGSPDGSGTVYQMAHRVSLLMHRREGYAEAESDPFLVQVSDMTQAIGFYRNIVAFHRGANTYPSNLGLDLTNPEVSAVFEQIAEQEARDPSPTSVLSRIDMLIWGGRVDAAAGLAMQAAARHPRERPLLHSLARMMAWAGQTPALSHIEALLRELG